jgi:CHAT domain-containing protein
MLRRLVIGSVLAGSQSMALQPGLADSGLPALRAERDRYIDEYRRSGRTDAQRLAGVQARLQQLAASQAGEARLRTQLELATVTRLLNRFPEAAALYQALAADAQRAGHADIAFDAWIGAARAHAYGTRDHGAADSALENAIATAGDSPVPKQLHDIAAFRAQVLAARGDFDAALLASLQALARAGEPADRFYAELDTASILLNLAETCDYRTLVDARTRDDPPGEAWGGCRRAVNAASAGFEAAAATAASLGWAALAQQARAFQRDLPMRLFVINGRADAERLREGAVFAPGDVSDVLANRNFAAPPSSASPALARLVEQAVADGAGDPRSLYLRGMAADMRGDRSRALKLFRQAADGLANERKGLFDARRRGTVVENRAEIMRDLALTLLAAGAQQEAFATLEAFRSRGLSELAAALAQPDLSEADRRWLAALLDIEARSSARDVRVRERVVASAKLALSEGELREAESDERARGKLLSQAAVRERVARAVYRPAGLADVQAASDRAGTPVALYWVTPTNVLVWIVAPGVSEVRTVFLPEGVLQDRVRRVAMASRSPDAKVDEEAARQLYLYLLAPFEQWLAAPRLMIVPQGPLVDLPFEALIDPRSRRHAVEKWAISYAPNATLAALILASPPPVVRSVRAIVDEVVDAGTGEVARLRATRGLSVDVVASHAVDPAALSSAVAGAQVVHVLAHGNVDSYDPLLGWLRLSDKRRLTAAQLVSTSWRHVELAVLASCDSGALTRRISNEIYGFPWALMVAGAHSAVVSRWRIDGPANAEWMADFYGELAKGASPGGAAAAAARGMIARGRSHPYYWAPMRVIGR